MTLLDELDGGLDVVGHLQPRHHDGQSPPAEGADCDFVFDVGELSTAYDSKMVSAFVQAGSFPHTSAAGSEQAHIPQLGQEQIFLSSPKRIARLECGEAMCQLTQRACQSVVFGVVVAFLEAVSAYYGGIAVVAVRLVCVEVDLPQQLLLVVLELADHDGGQRAEGRVVAEGAEV